MDNAERDGKISEHETQIAVHKTEIAHLKGKMDEHHDTLYREDGVVDILKGIAVIIKEDQRREELQPAKWQVWGLLAAVIIALLSLLWGVFGQNIQRGGVAHGTTASIIQCR